jgi:radical SAM protein with 4Fe4S-binding SPASM domain
MKLGETFQYWRAFQKVRSIIRGYRPSADMEHHPFPGVVQVQTINACNAACIMCPYGKTPQPKLGGRMDEALWEKIVTEISGRPEVETFIPMLQNEPFLDQNILQKVASFKEKSKGPVHVELVTHGGLLTDESIEMIRRSKLDVLSISVDSIHREVYEKIRVGLNYDRVMGNIQKLLKAKLQTRIIIRMVRQAANRYEVKEFVAHWKSLGLETVMWDVTNRSGALPHFDALEVPREELPWYSLVSDALVSKVMPHCPIPFYMTSILHNGDMLVCGFDWLHESVIGNVREHTISELWNSDKMREIRQLHYKKRAANIAMCSNCSIWQKTWRSKKTSEWELDQ